MNTNPSTPLGVYVHIPYCLKKCPYCDFNSYALKSHAGSGRGAVESMPEAEYVKAICTELAHYRVLEGWADRSAASIFFGGGTPSLFAPASIRQIIGAIRDSFALDPAAEITIEANPGTIDEALGAEKLLGFKTAGINRISFGAQSFSATKLSRLGRIHLPDDVPRAVHFARAAGIEQVSIDLMFGIEGESLDEWQRDLSIACSLATDHLSVYGLTIEPGTDFDRLTRRGNQLAADDDLQAEMYLCTQSTLAAAGFEQYEISNYAKPGAKCRHNLGYWQGRDYLGLGAGAHSFLRQRSSPHSPWGQRWSNIPGPALYIVRSLALGDCAQRRDPVGEAQGRTEFFFLGLRLKEGIAKAEFEHQFGESFDSRYRAAVDSLTGEGLITDYEGRIALTKRGFLFADTVMASFE